MIRKLKIFWPISAEWNTPNKSGWCFCARWTVCVLSIFCYLQVKDVYTETLKVKDAICLDYDKNKGKNKCSYYLNSQIKKEFAEYLKYLQQTRSNLNQESYLFTSQKQNKPYNRVSISRLFSSVYRKFSIKGASHLGRHLFVSKIGKFRREYLFGAKAG